MNFRFLINMILLFSLSVFSDEIAIIKEKISVILPPDTKIESIERSNFPSVYKVYYGDIQPLYVSADGNYFLYGDMFQIKSSKIINLTDIDISKRRISLMNEINK